MNQHIFQADVDDSSILKQFENGNVRLYSLNQSFNDDVLWRIVAVSKIEQNTIFGKIEKIVVRKNDYQVTNSYWVEAKEAVKGAFTTASNVTLLTNEDAPNFKLNLSEEAKGNCAFTLRGFAVAKNSNVSDYFDKKDSKFEVTTWDVRQENVQNYVHGLIVWKTGSEYPDLVDLAQVLGQKFGREQITWMQYCTNPEAWVCYNQQGQSRHHKPIHSQQFYQ